MLVIFFLKECSVNYWIRYIDKYWIFDKIYQLFLTIFSKWNNQKYKINLLPFFVHFNLSSSVQIGCWPCNIWKLHIHNPSFFALAFKIFKVFWNVLLKVGFNYHAFQLGVTFFTVIWSSSCSKCCRIHYNWNFNRTAHPFYNFNHTPYPWRLVRTLLPK